MTTLHNVDPPFLRLFPRVGGIVKAIEVRGDPFLLHRGAAIATSKARQMAN